MIHQLVQELVRAWPIVRWTLRVIWVRSVMCCLVIADKEQRNRSASVSLIGRCRQLNHAAQFI
jgi:hypothetical protein